jgi:prepilin-type N-terminal cleavage/methylation domain-containing protein
MNKQKGFTIIELIVVIAIIAVLAAIVLVNVTSYINKSKNAAVKGNMATILTNSAVYFDTNPASTGSQFGTDPLSKVPGVAAAAADNGGVAITFNGSAVASAQNWCACAPLFTTTADLSGSTFCVDSTGAKKETTTACATECSSSVFSCQ